MMADDAATRAARLTPRGRGAVATIRVSGPAATHAVSQFLRPLSGRPFDASPLRAIIVGNWVRSASQQEELVATKLEDSLVEVHSHGGEAACGAILADLKSLGVIVPADPWSTVAEHDHSWEFRAFQMLTDAATARVASVLLDQHRGAFRQLLSQIQTEAVGDSESQIQATSKLERLVELIELGAHLILPWRVVLAGPPNVGKSSLINALLGYERTIVWDQPGTTRDIVSTTTALDGWPVELSDTAGIHDTSQSLETAGIERAQRTASDADLVVIVADARMVDAPQIPVLRRLASRSLLVANKSDLLPTDARLPTSWLPTSVTSGRGLDELQAAIVRQLVPRPPAPGEAVPFLPDFATPLRAALTAIRQGNALEDLPCS